VHQALGVPQPHHHRRQQTHRERPVGELAQRRGDPIPEADLRTSASTRAIVVTQPASSVASQHGTRHTTQETDLRHEVRLRASVLRLVFSRHQPWGLPGLSCSGGVLALVFECDVDVLKAFEPLCLGCVGVVRRSPRVRSTSSVKGVINARGHGRFARTTLTSTHTTSVAAATYSHTARPSTRPKTALTAVAFFKT
jgi:hypothetical protein